MICKNCKQEIQNKRRKTFCDNKCLYDYWKIKYFEAKCSLCNKKYLLRLDRKQDKVRGKFCSPQCRSKFHSKQMIGSGNSKWHGGYYYKDGYKFIYQPTHPFANALGYIREHRLFMEKNLGRYLLLQEVVHHINKIRDFNNLNNLQLFNNNSDHIKFGHRR